MTQRIIYHDFRSKPAAQSVALTAPMLRKGRRIIKTFAHVNTALSTGCMFLCGACSAVSLLVLLLLVRGN